MSNRQSPTTFIGQLDFSGTTHAGVKANSLTTAQRDALTPSNGMFIYNTSNARFEKYEAGGWQPTSSGSLPKIAVIVGASQADYITDGTADNVEIQQAIDAATAAGGGHVYLQAGTYNLAATINLKSNVILEGQGVGTILKPVSGTSIITAYSSGGAITCQTISQAAVISLRIDGTNFQHDSAAVHIDNCSDIKVGNCRIDNINGFGVFTTAGLTGSASGTTQRVTIFNNYIYGYGLNDLIGGGAYTTTATVTDVKAYANELIQDCTVNGYGNAIDMIGTTRMTITGNDSTGSINMGTEHGNHSYMVISGNTIKPAINLSSSNGRIQVTASSLSTANSDTITISNNTLMSVGSIGVKGISTMYLQNVAITGNVLKGNTTQSGIQLWFTQQATVTGNTVDGAYSCIQILSSTNAEILGNSFNNANYGINEDSNSPSVLIGPNHYNNIAVNRTVGGNTSLTLPGMTTTQRDALGAVNGTLIYNTTNGRFEKYESSTWQAVTTSGAGSGDVVGSLIATDNAVARFDGTSGKLIQNSTAVISDNGSMTITPSSSGTTLTLIEGSISSTALDLRANTTDYGTSIIWWKDPTSLLNTNRLGQITGHGTATGSLANEMAWYTTDSTGAMQNRMKFWALTDNSPLILTGATGIARTSAGLIKLGEDVAGAGTSKVRTEDSLGVGISPSSRLHSYENTTATDSTAGATIEQNGTGDAVIQFLLTATRRWVLGIDNSDSDKFKIAASADVGGAPLFTMTTSGAITLAVPLNITEGGTNATNAAGARSNLGAQAKSFVTVGMADADYICDGTSDDVQIQQAINYVGGTLGGGTVYIKGGTTTYDISATLTINYSNVRLIGDGASTKLRLKNAANVHGITMGVSTADGYSGIVLQDFYFDGNRTNQTGDNVTQGTSYGCVMYSCSQCVFQNVSFNNWSVIGIFVGGTTFRRNGHHKIINCEASNCNFDGFEYNFCNYNLIENCIAQGNGHGGIYDKGGTGNMIVGNDCSLNNYLLGFGGNALVVQFTTKGIYTNNQCSGGYASGFGCQDVDQAIITNNTCCTTGFDGLRFDGIKNSLISGNICNDNGQFGGSSKNGINLFKTNGTFDCTNNIISGNYCGNLAGSTQAYGIITQNTSDSNLVTDNILQGNSTAPLNLAGTSNVVKNNTNWNPDVFYSQGNVTGATIFDRKNGYHVLATATGNITTTVTNGKTTGDEIVLEIKQDATGGRTISKPSNVKLVGGAFSPTATANAIDVWSLRWDGTSWVETGRSLNVS